MAGRNLRASSAAHFRVRFGLFAGDAGVLPVALSDEADCCLPLLSWSFAGPPLSAVVGSVEILPPSFSHRSSILFFRRFLAMSSGIGISSLLDSMSHSPSRRGNCHPLPSFIPSPNYLCSRHECLSLTLHVLSSRSDFRCPKPSASDTGKSDFLCGRE